MDRGLDHIFATEAKCQHNQGFSCQLISVDEKNVQYAMVCSCYCQYWLPFSPEHAGKIKEEPVPSDHRFDAWKLNTVTFIPFPRVDPPVTPNKKLVTSPW